MPNTIPAGLNPVLILSTLQRRQCDKSELMRLHVKAIQFESLLNNLTGAGITLESLAKKEKSPDMTNPAQSTNTRKAPIKSKSISPNT